MREPRDTVDDGPCVDCRDGLACAEEWAAWHARADETEAAWVAEHGSTDGLTASARWLSLLDERPEADPETECPECGGGQRPHGGRARDGLAAIRRPGKLSSPGSRQARTHHGTVRSP